MKSKKLKRTGIALILAGMAGLGMSLVGLVQSYSAQAGESAAVLAGNVSESLLPASIGAPMVLVGLIFVLLFWWRGREAKRVVCH